MAETVGLSEAPLWCVTGHGTSTDGYWCTHHSCSIPSPRGHQAFGSVRSTPVCDPVPSLRNSVSDDISPGLRPRSWGEGSFPSEVLSLLWFSERSPCRFWKQSVLESGARKRFVAKSQESVTEKNFCGGGVYLSTAQVGDCLQVGVQVCQKEAFFCWKA